MGIVHAKLLNKVSCCTVYIYFIPHHQFCFVLLITANVLGETLLRHRYCHSGTEINRSGAKLAVGPIAGENTINS